MRKFPSLLREPEFHALLFVVCLILFSRPKLFMPKTELPATVMVSFFLPWALIIVIMFFVARSYNAPASEETQDSESEQAE